ncbi:Uncharacterised protein [uncultured archaeon]|nr:Uncharacterised protein [uncultured archaeon]
MATVKTTREYRRARREAILAETRADVERARKIGEKADRIYDQAMRRRIPIPA